MFRQLILPYLYPFFSPSPPNTPFRKRQRCATSKNLGRGGDRVGRGRRGGVRPEANSGWLGLEGILRYREDKIKNYTLELTR